METKICHEKCPLCGNDIIEYGDGHFEDDCYYYNVECEKCGAEFTEVYRVVYDHTEFK